MAKMWDKKRCWGCNGHYSKDPLYGSSANGERANYRISVNQTAVCLADGHSIIGRIFHHIWANRNPLSKGLFVL
jgi:hypothetical protein